MRATGAGLRRRDRRPTLGDGWYSWHLPGVRPLTDRLEAWPDVVSRLAWRVGLLRGALLFLASLGYRRVAMIRADRGWRSLLLLRACLGRRRKLVAWHFIDFPPPTGRRGRAAYRLWRPVERWALRRALHRAQVLSAWEVPLYAARFGLAPSRFCHIPFAWRRDADAGVPERGDGPVLAAGRAFCDWETLFAAAASAAWPLTVVCGAHDREVVRRLNANGRAEVLCEVPGEKADELLRIASVAVINMYDAGVSQGHVRLMDAVEAGVPVVASAVRAFHGYAVDGETALLVKPGDAGALGAAIDRLATDEAARERLRRAAADRARGWTWRQYLAALQALVDDAPVAGPPFEAGQ